MKELFENINIGKILKYLLFMFLSLTAQNMVLGQIRIAGVAVMVLPSVAVAVGMFEGAAWGAVFSLVMGIFADMSFVENTTAFALLFPALAFFSGFVSQFFINRRFFAFMGLSAGALLLTGVYQMVRTLAGDVWHASMLVTVAMQTLISIPPSALAYFPPARWIK